MNVSKSAEFTAQILIEAMPYIQRFHGKTVVIKFGGNAMVDAQLKRSFAEDVVLLKLIGIHPVIVHGGGPQINTMLDKVGKQTEFINGLRVTDKETMDVVEMVLGGLVNHDIVRQINTQGGKAVGLSGKDGTMIRARKLTNLDNSVDYGHVGEVESVDCDVVHTLQQKGFIPVIAPIAADRQGNTYNINADTVAGEIAATLSAEKLVLMTNTKGVLNAFGELISELTSTNITHFEQQGIIKGGMLPKVHCALNATKQNVNSAHIIDGRVKHALLLELLTDGGVGTLIRQ